MRARALLVLAALASAATAEAQVGTTSNTATVTLNATQQPTLAISLSATSASVTSINPGATTNFPSIDVTAAWNLTSGTSVDLVGWFGTPAQALTGASGDIASARVRGRTGGNAYAAFTGAPVGGQGVAGGTLGLWTIPVAGNLQNTATTNLDLQLDYAGQPAPAAGSYAGTLNLRAVVQ